MEEFEVALPSKEQQQATDALFKDLTYRLEAVELKAGKAEREASNTTDELKRA